MRRSLMLLTAPILLMAALGVALAQDQETTPQPAPPDGNWMDVGGGVRVRVPAETPTEPSQISPPTGAGSTGQGTTQSGTAQQANQPPVAHGRQSGRSEVDAEGNTRQVWQSTRVSGVHQSTVRDRFNWFYDADDVYQGVIPQVRDTLPHIAAHQARGAEPSQRNEVTWIGFQPLNDRTRVFVQFARTPHYTVTEEQQGHLIAIDVDNTRLSLSNFGRAIDTSYFGRSVDLIDAQELPGRRTRVVIWRDDIVPYTVSLQGNYLYVEFQDLNRPH